MWFTSFSRTGLSTLRRRMTLGPSESRRRGMGMRHGAIHVLSLRQKNYDFGWTCVVCVSSLTSPIVSVCMCAFILHVYPLLGVFLCCRRRETASHHMTFRKNGSFVVEHNFLEGEGGYKGVRYSKIFLLARAGCQSRMRSQETVLPFSH